ncbi:MAG TPA: DNA uptake porin HofQ [Enterobacteriaceae bacterium]|nr:DNA uptake porin HofQ [Enterobacteriaceae bacterium]
MKPGIAMLLIALLPLPGTAIQNPPVSMTVDEVPVVQVLQSLAEIGGQSLVVAPGVKGTLSLQLHEVPLSQALQAVASSAGLVLRQQGDILYVDSQARRQERQTQLAAEQARKRQNLPLIDDSITVRYADASELAKAGDKLLSARGTLTVDTRMNRLLLRDDKATVQAFLAWVARMDLPVGQVELAAHIVTINEDSLKALGVKWQLAEERAGAGNVSSLLADVSASAATSRLGFNIGRINGRLLALELSALEQKQQLEIIASPRLLTAHMQPASIKQGSEIPYQVSSGEKGATSVEFKEAVLGMEVTPTVLQQDRIRLKLRISQNMPGQVLKQGEGETLTIDKQEIETVVEVKSGETLALGGIFQRRNSTTDDRVPLLGDIPLLGRLFRHEGKDRQRRELVVFITPRLVTER